MPVPGTYAQTWLRMLDLPTPEAPMTTSLTVRIPVSSRRAHGQIGGERRTAVVVETQENFVSREAGTCAIS